MIQNRTKYSNSVISDNMEALQDIRLKSKNIAIYERNIDHIKNGLEKIMDQEIKCRASGSKEEILEILTKYFDLNLPEYNIVLEDVSSLLTLFEKVIKASSYRLLLATVSANMCRKFHTDLNDLRMLCTYVGPGTIWVPDEIVDCQSLRAKRGDAELDIEERHIQQVSTGEVVILKGALYEEANPILHRSPTIEENGERRLLLRIDTNETSNLFA